MSEPLSSTMTNLHEELQDALKMRESISELKSEIHALNESLKDARRQLEEAKQPRTQQPRSYAAATRLNKANGGAKVSTTQRTGFLNTEKSASSNGAKKATAPHSKPGNDRDTKEGAVGKCKVPGARRIWGPFYICSPNAVLGCIKKLTGLDVTLKIRKKTKDLPNNNTI